MAAFNGEFARFHPRGDSDGVVLPPGAVQVLKQAGFISRKDTMTIYRFTKAEANELLLAVMEECKQYEVDFPPFDPRDVRVVAESLHKCVLEMEAARNSGKPKRTRTPKAKADAETPVTPKGKAK